MAAIVHYLERLFDFSREAGGLIAGNEKLLAEIVWPHFWAIQIVLFVLILMYCTMHEFARRDRRGQGETNVLRAAANPAGLSAHQWRTEGAAAASARVIALGSNTAGGAPRASRGHEILMETKYVA